MANQVDFKIAPSDQFSVYSPSTRSEKTITYFTLLSKLRGDILAVSQEEDPNDIVAAYYSNTGGTQTLHLVKADGSEITASQSEQVISGTLNYVSKFTSSNDIGDSQIFDDGTNVGIGTTTMTHKLQLGTGGVFADYFQLDTTYSNGFVVGALSWDIDNGTADIGLSGTLKLKIGQDDVWYVKNQTGSPIAKGVAVYANGTLGASGRITVAPMIANGTIPAKYFLGITAEAIANGADGYVLAKGKLRQINTNAYNEGDVLWVSPSSAGALTSTEPTAPNLKLPVAFVVYKANNGILAIRATIGTRIEDASDVNYTGASDNSFLVYNSSTGVWEDETVGIFKTIAVSGQSNVVADSYTDTLTLVAGTNVTITTDATTDSITINSTDQYVGTVTSVATTAPITGGTITTTGTIGITQSGTASDGYLSSADWNTFNGKEPALTKGNLTESTSAVLTITGGTGAVIGTGTTIQVTQASSTASGYLSSTDWTTFNGKASNSFTTIAVATQTNIVADSATDTLTIAAGTGVSITTDALTDTLTISATGSGGTVTSISTTAPITGGPITGIGTISITQSGTASDGYLSSADWNTFNGKQNAITLTTTGSSGAATLVGATLNIPQYTDQFTGTVTSVAALTLGTTGTDLSSTVANGTTTPVITLNVPTASATNRGALSSGDWTTFNGKQNAITLTTTGTSGASTLVGATLNIPQYTDQYTGTVTSVDLTAGTGISVSGGPIITSGSITVNNTDRGSSQNIFKNIAVSGQSTIIADNNDDTLNVVAGDRIDITTTAASDILTITHGSATGADFTTAEDFRDRVIADGGIFEALGEVAIAIGSLEDIASPASTDYSDGFVLQNIAVDEFGHVLGVGATDLDERYAQVAFKNVAVSGQATIVADAIEDTLNIAAGYGVSITTDDTTDTVTIGSQFIPYPVYAASMYQNALTTPFVVTSSWSVVNIDGTNIQLSAPVDSDGVYTENLATVMISIENQKESADFVCVGIRLYNQTQGAIITDSTHTWTGYLNSLGNDSANTIFTYHIPIEEYVATGDTIRVQMIDLNANTPEVNFASFSLLATSGPV